MALIESLAIPLGTRMQSFSLKTPGGQSCDSAQFFTPQAKGLLVAFTCNHCPYAVAVWPRLIRLAGFAEEVGVQTVAINPNINPDYPDDSPENMTRKIKEWGIPFPYLIDETQKTAKDFKAQCTPDIYLFDRAQKLAYHGRIDDNWKEESKVRHEELKDAIQALAKGQAVSLDQKPSMGCSIKWRS